MKDLKFEDLPKAVEAILEKLEMIESRLKTDRQNFQHKEQVELMTRKETADYLKINTTTLWHWTNKGKLKSYGIGNRVYYKRNEVIESIAEIK